MLHLACLWIQPYNYTIIIILSYSFCRGIGKSLLTALFLYNPSKLLSLHRKGVILVKGLERKQCCGQSLFTSLQQAIWTFVSLSLLLFWCVFHLNHCRFPNHFFLNTEACTGWTGPPSERGVHLGEWSRGSNYSHSIIEVCKQSPAISESIPP